MIETAARRQLEEAAAWAAAFRLDQAPKDVLKIALVRRAKAMAGDAEDA